MTAVVAVNALAALRARFPEGELAALSPLPYPDVVRQARERRSAALIASRWSETPDSEREVDVIKAVGAFVLEHEARAVQAHIEPWDGGLL